METKLASNFDTTVHVYLDESGNSGPNLLDASQPVYVLGGWVVPRIYVPDAEQAVRNLAAKLGRPGSEIHGVDILRTAKGQSAFADFTRSIGQSGGAPVFNISEKRYWIAGKVVETYLDPFFNKEVPWEFYNDIIAKQELADEISQLHDEPLREFAAAYRLLDVDRLQAGALRFATLFQVKGESKLSHWFRCAVAGMP